MVFMEHTTKIQKGVDCAVIGLFGDDPNDYMARCGVKWLHKNGCYRKPLENPDH